MTTLSMNAATIDRDLCRPVVPAAVAAVAARASSAIDHVSTGATEWAVEHLLGAAGGMMLALAPFSFLAWMFIAH